MAKICKDGRIWGQNNKEAKNHLGILTGRHPQEYIRKGYNMNSAFPEGNCYNSTLGTHLTDKAKKHMSETRIRKGLSRGVNNAMYGVHNYGASAGGWKGGLTSLGVLVRNSSEYKRWRSDVFKRDYWTCQTCQRKGGGIRVQAHHKKPFAQIMGENHITAIWEVQKCQELWDVSNGVTLCEECHRLAHGKDL